MKENHKVTNMSTVMQPSLVSVEEYLKGEQNSDLRHEYVAGRIYAMGGDSKAHNRIAGNLYAALLSHLRGGPCQVYIADVKVQVAAARAFYYPDVVVSCDPADTDSYLVSSPCLIVEVLSPSTERIDQEEKRYNYRRLASLQEYALISPDRREVQIDRREEATWRMDTYVEGDRVRLESVALDLAVGEIFAGAR